VISNIGRRAFLTTLGGAAAASSLLRPFAARAQQPALPVVAFIHAGSPTDSASRAAAFRQGLSETGYVEGQNVTVEYHWLGEQYERLPVLMADFVRRRVAVIATAGSPATLAAKAATTTIPIAFGMGRVRSSRRCRSSGSLAAASSHYWARQLQALGHKRPHRSRAIEKRDEAAADSVLTEIGKSHWLVSQLISNNPVRLPTPNLFLPTIPTSSARGQAA
jgi:hypothetical protein